MPTEWWSAAVAAKRGADGDQSKARQTAQIEAEIGALRLEAEFILLRAGKLPPAKTNLRSAVPFQKFRRILKALAELDEELRQALRTAVFCKCGVEIGGDNAVYSTSRGSSYRRNSCSACYREGQYWRGRAWEERNPGNGRRRARKYRRALALRHAAETNNVGRE